MFSITSDTIILNDCELITGMDDYSNNYPENNEFQIYPNPADKYIHCTIPGNNEAKYVWITNILGSKIREVKINGKHENLKINISDLDPGIYLVSILSENDVLKTRRLVKY